MMEDETHVAIDLAVEADEQLLREALEALQGCLGVQYIADPSVYHAVLEQARTAITKLEERLLRE